MPKYFCEYCGIYLTHSSPGGRNQHSKGRKHINNKIEYFSQILYEFQQNSISSDLIKLSLRLLNKAKGREKKDKNSSNNDNSNKLDEKNSNDIQLPISIPTQYVPNIPINEKIMKAIPSKFIQPQYKNLGQNIANINKKEIFENNEKDNNNVGKSSGPKTKNILEVLNKMKYTYNDPNPENNEQFLSDLLKNEDEEEPNNTK